MRFSSPNHRYRLWGFMQAPICCVYAILSRNVMPLEPKYKHLPSYSAEVDMHIPLRFRKKVPN
jgi:hypothetical protein